MPLGRLFSRGKGVSCSSRTTGEYRPSTDSDLAGCMQQSRNRRLISSFFCNTVMTAPSADTDGAEASGRGLSTTSRVYLVRKAGLKLLKDGMGEYETMLRNRLRKQGLTDAS